MKILNRYYKENIKVNKLSRQKERRLNYLCYKNYNILQHFPNFESCIESMIQPQKKDICEILILLKEKFYNDYKNANNFWSVKHLEKFSYQKTYYRKPSTPKKDNQLGNIYKDIGRGNPNIRYPKKCRKTAWKRFYKIFPKLKPNEDIK